MQKISLFIFFVILVCLGNNWARYQFGKTGVPEHYRYLSFFEEKQVLGVTGNNYAKFDGKYFQYTNFSDDIKPVESVAFDFLIENDTSYWMDPYEDTYTYVNYNPKTESSVIYLKSELGITFTSIFLPDIAPNGNIWFKTGSEDGAVVYDREKWYKFDTTNTPMPMNFYNHICFDSSGNTFLSGGNVTGSKGGVTKFDGEKWEHFDYNNSPIPKALVKTIEVDKNNVLWIASDSGLNTLDGDTWKTWTVDDIPFNEAPKLKGFSSMAISPNNVPWMRSNTNYIYLKDDTWTVVDESYPNYPDKDYGGYTPVFDSSGNVWIITSNVGIIKIDYEKCTVYDSTNSIIPSEYPDRVRVLPNGEVWSGFSKYDPQSDTWSKPLTPYNTGLANDTVHAITTLKDGRPFIVTNYGVSVRDSLQRWTVYEKDHLENFPINDIDYLITSGDTTYAFRAGYVSPNYGAIFVKGEWKEQSALLPENATINDVHKSDDGTLWFATSKGITAKFGALWKEFSTEGLPSGDVLTITTIENQPIIGNSYGAFYYTGESWQEYQAINELVSSDYTVDLESDSLGRLWVATLRDGILSYDNSNWILYDTTNSELPQDVITKISADKMGNVWVATLDSGVGVFKNGQFKAYNTENSDLQSNTITDIVFDKRNQKWFTTEFSGIANLIDEDSLIVSIIDDNFVNNSKAKLSCQLSRNSLAINGLNENALVNIYNIKGQRLLQVEISQKQNKIPLSSNLTQSILFLEVLQGSKRYIFKLTR